MTTVYVVATGEYSDWRIASICSTSEKAELVHDAIGSENRIYEYVLDAYDDSIDQGLSCWRIVMRRDGDTMRSFKTEPTGEMPCWNVWEKYETQTDYPSRLVGVMWACDEQHAVKIANEKRAQMIALGEWAPD